MTELIHSRRSPFIHTSRYVGGRRKLGCLPREQQPIGNRFKALAAAAAAAAAAAGAGAAAKPKPKPGHSPPPASHSPQANAGWRGSGRRERSRVRAETQRPLPRAARRRRWGWRMPQLHHLALVVRKQQRERVPFVGGSDRSSSGCLSAAAFQQQRCGGQ
jgi:hypothetical protein